MQGALISHDKRSSAGASILMMVSPFRELTDAERAIVNRLLAQPFPGRDEAVRQVETCRVRPCDEMHCPSLEFEVQGGVLIPNSGEYSRPLPIDALAADVDGVPM